MENKDQQQKYKAFISYSHGNNQGEGRKWADWLHHALETYEIPEDLIGKKNQAGKEIPRQIYPVFQDEKELSASSSLSHSLTSALDKSEYLIFLSSPRSANSTYVRDEIKYFKQTGKSQQIMALIISGEPEYGDVKTEKQCFPDELRFAISPDGQIDYAKPEEVLAADVRIPNTQDEGFTSAEAYRRYLHEKNVPAHQIKAEVEEYKKRLDLALLKLIAGILEVPLSELTKRDQAYQLEKIRQKNRRMKKIATAIAALAILAVIAGIFAWNQRNSALRNLARSLYASGINKLTESEYGDGAAYIAEATRRGDESAKLFAHSMLAVQEDLMQLPNMNYGNIRFSPDGKWLVGFANVGQLKQVLQIWDAVNRKLHKQVDDVFTSQARYPLFDANNRTYVIADNYKIVRYDIANDKKEVLRENPDSNFIALYDVAPNGQYIAFKKDKDIILYNTQQKTEQILYQSKDMNPVTVFFDPGSKRIVMEASLGESYEVYFFDISTGAIKQLDKKKLNKTFKRPTFSKDGSQMVIQNSEGIFYFNFINGASWANFSRTDYRYAGFSDKNQIFAGNDQSIDQYNPTTGSFVKTTKLPRNLFFFTGLAKILENDPRTLEYTSPDWTQNLNSSSKQTFLENRKALPLNIGQYYEEANMNVFIPGLTDQTAFVSYHKQNQIDLLDLSTGEKKVGFIKVPEEIVTMMVLHESKNILVKGKTGKSYIFDAQTGKAKGKPFQAEAKLYLFNKEQTQVLTRTGSKSFAAWDIATGKQLFEYKEDKDIQGFAVSSDLKLAIIVNPNHWRVLDISSKKVLKEGKESLSSGAFSPSGNHLVIVDGSGNAQVLETKNYSPILKFKSIEYPYIVFNTKGNVLAISEDANHIRLWDLEKKKSFGQTIRVSKYAKFLYFSKDDEQIFVQDDGESSRYMLKIIDAKTGNVLTMPFINQRFDNIYIMPGDKKIMTRESLMDGSSVFIWEIPGQVEIPKDQLAKDLERFYGKKYDEETGAILNYSDSSGTYNTWYFEDPFTRSISPNSNVKILDILHKNFPIKNASNLQVLGVTYDYHPLARAMMAKHFSAIPDQQFIGKRLMEITEKQLIKIKDKALKAEVESLLKEARQNLNK
ncbi:TIR domain-containing protein [Sphingobacterium lactis]|uniref:TIR domain-containing protein n=1 Tax=Sphingobacterium lactis TaxID=797291 RepID=UPI003F7DBFA8